MATMGECWDAVVVWMRECAPQVLELLAPPATEGEICEAEKALGVRFPADLKWLYRRHNACTVWYKGFELDGAYWFPLAEVQAQWAVWKGVRDEGLKSGTWTDFPGDEYARGSWISQWVPITDSHGGGWGHCVDLKPGRKGKKGQVLRVYSDSTAVAAAGIREWLLSYATDLRAGNWPVSKAGGLYPQGYPDPAD